MPILKYIPPIKKIIDHRSSEGGYYEAICNNCGTKFYPERSNAKYCSPNCGLIQHRKEKAEILSAGGVVTKKLKLKRLKKEIEDFRGYKAIYQYLKENTNTHGYKHEIINALKETDIGDDFTFNDITFIRKSPGKWVLYKGN